MKTNISAEALEKILQSVWCITCVEPTVMKNYSVRPVENEFILDGQCARCGGFVSRVVEMPGIVDGDG